MTGQYASFVFVVQMRGTRQTLWVDWGPRNCASQKGTSEIRLGSNRMFGFQATKNVLLNLSPPLPSQRSRPYDFDRRFSGQELGKFRALAYACPSVIF